MMALEEQFAITLDEEGALPRGGPAVDAPAGRISASSCRCFRLNLR